MALIYVGSLEQVQVVRSGVSEEAEQSCVFSKMVLCCFTVGVGAAAAGGGRGKSCCNVHSSLGYKGPFQVSDTALDVLQPSCCSSSVMPQVGTKLLKLSRYVEQQERLQMISVNRTARRTGKHEHGTGAQRLTQNREDWQE